MNLVRQQDAEDRPGHEQRGVHVSHAGPRGERNSAAEAGGAETKKHGWIEMRRLRTTDDVTIDDAQLEARTGRRMGPFDELGAASLMHPGNPGFSLGP
eukprot:3361281-Pyramimonas_sp.AAC.1